MTRPRSGPSWRRSRRPATSLASWSTSRPAPRPAPPPAATRPRGAGGAERVGRQRPDLLEGGGREEIAAGPGGAFDPRVQGALSRQPSKYPGGAIVEVGQRGSLRGAGVARPAKVVVSGGNEGE